MAEHDFTSSSVGDVENVFGRRLQLVSTSPDVYVEVGTTGAVPGITPGTVFWYGGTTPPAYALECDGSEYSESVYAQLFAAIGSTFNTGGETASYFRVPNISGGSGVNRFIRGADGTTFSVGDTGVDAAPDIDGSIQVAYSPLGTATGALSSGGTFASTRGSNASNAGGILEFHASDDDPTYSDSATEVTPQYIALLPCIAFTDFFNENSYYNPSYLFASIPSVLEKLGQTVVITDSSTTTWGAAIAGSGANTVLAWYNGSNWTVIGI